MLVIFVAYVLAVVVVTGALLDKGRAPRSWRLFIWAGVLLLFLPFSAAVFYVLAWVFYGGKYWFY